MPIDRLRNSVRKIANDCAIRAPLQYGGNLGLLYGLFYSIPGAFLGLISALIGKMVVSGSAAKDTLETPPDPEEMETTEHIKA